MIAKRVLFLLYMDPLVQMIFLAALQHHEFFKTSTNLAIRQGRDISWCVGRDVANPKEHWAHYVKILGTLCGDVAGRVSGGGGVRFYHTILAWWVAEGSKCVLDKITENRRRQYKRPRFVL